MAELTLCQEATLTELSHSWGGVRCFYGIHSGGESTLSWLASKKLVTLCVSEFSMKWYITDEGKAALAAGRI